VSLVRLLRLAFCVALVALASGAPHVVLAAMDDDGCPGSCDADVGGKSCPPNCAHGVCAKTVVSVSWPVGDADEPVLPSSPAVALETCAPVLPLVVAGMFHPPQR
jgi:hypothetical protein